MVHFYIRTANLTRYFTSDACTHFQTERKLLVLNSTVLEKRLLCLQTYKIISVACTHFQTKIELKSTLNSTDWENVCSARNWKYHNWSSTIFRLFNIRPSAETSFLLHRISTQKHIGTTPLFLRVQTTSWSFLLWTRTTNWWFGLCLMDGASSIVQWINRYKSSSGIITSSAASATVTKHLQSFPLTLLESSSCGRPVFPFIRPTKVRIQHKSTNRLFSSS